MNKHLQTASDELENYADAGGSPNLVAIVRSLIRAVDDAAAPSSSQQPAATTANGPPVTA